MQLRHHAILMHPSIAQFNLYNVYNILFVISIIRKCEIYKHETENTAHVRGINKSRQRLAVTTFKYSNFVLHQLFCVV